MVVIHEAFESLSDEKQLKIINAALSVFTEHGYKLASTNEIVKIAGIGKGMLFYYFENKHELFNFLLDYSFNCVNKYLENVEKLSKEYDFIERYRLASKYKMEIYIKYPCVFSFMIKIYLNQDMTGFSEQTIKKYNEFQTRGKQIIQNLYADSDVSKFRTDISAEKLIRYIRWFMDGYAQEMTERLKNDKLSDVDLVPYWKEFDEHLDNLKMLIYKTQS